MALTPFRWIALAAIGCMFVFFSLVELRHDLESDTEWMYGRFTKKVGFDSVEERLSAKASSSMKAAEYLASRYRALQIIDSVKRVMSRSPDTGAMRVFVDASYPAPTRAAMDSLIRRARGLKPGNSGVGVDVFAVPDLVSSVRGVGRYPLSAVEVRYELPAAPGQRCRVYIRSGHLRDGRVQRALHTRTAAEQLLGPCAFYAAFGEPGPRIRDWLLAGGWAYTTDGSWSGAADHRLFTNDDPAAFDGPSPALWYFNIGSKGPACIVGDLSACDTLAKGSERRAKTRAIGSYTTALDLGNRYFPLGLGLFGGEFLSDVVRESSRERFKAFWTSVDSVPKAYATATGKPWGQEVHEWMVSKYGVIHSGPRVTPYDLLVSIVLVAISLFVVFRSSLTRRYA